MEQDEPPYMSDQCMQRGELLRQLLVLETKADKDEQESFKEDQKQQQSTLSIATNNRPHQQPIINEIIMDMYKTKTKQVLSESDITKGTLCSNSNNSSSTTTTILRDDDDDDNLLTLQLNHHRHDHGHDIHKVVLDLSDNFICNNSASTEKDFGVQEEHYEGEEEEGVDQIDLLPDSKFNVLRYDSYLAHQRYSDDYKHANCHFVDFGIGQTLSSLSSFTSKFHDSTTTCNTINSKSSRLVIEQQRSLGKGGLVWDAGVILADHLIATQPQWTMAQKYTNSDTTIYYRDDDKLLKIVDLGAGTGISGLMIAKAIPQTHVYITDLPDMMNLIESNVKRNFPMDSIHTKFCSSTSTSSTSAMTDQGLITLNREDTAREVPQLTLKQSSIPLSESDLKCMYQCDDDHNTNDEEGHSDMEVSKQCNGRVSAKVLRWGMKEDYTHGPFDIIIAGDVVTSLYDPSALAQTIHDLAHKNSIVYICSKHRLDEYHVTFDDAMNTLFGCVTISKPITRLRNIDNMSIMRACEKLDVGLNINSN
jgi:predicted nicotinamide N-methyase